MRSAGIVFKGEEAGILTQSDDGVFTFRYHDAWMADSNKPGIRFAEQPDPYRG